jgi:hypothetical protein
MNRATYLLPLIFGVAVSASAQPGTSPPVSDPYARGYTAPHSPAAPTVNAVEGPITDSLNSQMIAGDSALQAQYDRDMAAYRAAVAANARKTMRDQIRYENQQRAYADAMFAWWLQTNACERGHVRACRAPTPDPADFY